VKLQLVELADLAATQPSATASADASQSELQAARMQVAQLQPQLRARLRERRSLDMHCMTVLLCYLQCRQTNISNTLVLMHATSCHSTW
jgi:hypothetical protein